MKAIGGGSHSRSIIETIYFFCSVYSLAITIASIDSNKMKVLVAGASGSIGGECLAQCLAHPKISTVVAFVRRDLPADVSSHPKLQCVKVADFAQWPKDVLETHADAAGMIW
ncbi:hypothetical protein RRF57_001419 [Xylaria bambusicola]|uniref:NAD(P)-binding domain-containing protein n=1 Tax=Xylaria bambusicola TaxID=326684 RepID=A0AAN7Z3H2_9PEZI